MLERVKIVVDGEVVRDYPHDSNFVVKEHIYVGHVEIILRYDGKTKCELKHVDRSRGVVEFSDITFVTKYFRDSCKPTQQEKDMLEMLHGIVIPWNNIEIIIEKYENKY